VSLHILFPHLRGFRLLSSHRDERADFAFRSDGNPLAQVTLLHLLGSDFQRQKVRPQGYSTRSLGVSNHAITPRPGAAER
jgi:hypothetical protein